MPKIDVNEEIFYTLAGSPDGKSLWNTREEFEEIKLHVPVGERVIERIMKNTNDRDFLEQARILVATHHEKWDGSGYPRGLKAENIPLQGRIMAIADVYDALISNRPYRKAIEHKEVVNIIEKNKGKHFDPALVDLFHSVSDKFHQFAMAKGMNYAGIREETLMDYANYA